MFKFGALMSVLILSACETGAVGWGQTHEVVLANAQAITIVYDPIVGGYQKATAIATQHCAQYKKAPVPTESEQAALSLVKTQTFECR